MMQYGVDMVKGLGQDELARINKINGLYDLYDGKQEWSVKTEDYKPTVKVTNWIRKLIDKKARFMFGVEPYFNIQSENEDNADLKETLLQEVLKDNKFHSKLLKACKDSLIGGKVALKLWADKDIGVKLIFAPAQEFVVYRDVEDIDHIYKVVFFYTVVDDKDKTKQRIKRQTWELVNGRCVLDERTFDGYGKEVSVEFDNYYNGLDFLPIVIFQNGGLTGETEGRSDVEILWNNQDSYNRLTSDDLDALKFQMFGQDVFTDAAVESLEAIKIAPGAMIDLQTDLAQAHDGRQAKVERLEGGFSYAAKYESTLSEIKDSMFSLMDIPNTSLAELKGMMASGKSMKAVYWDLMAVCDELWTEWESGLRQMVDYIFKLIETYNCYGEAATARLETDLTIEHNYPIQEDTEVDKRLDLDEVISGVRSKYSYVKKWSEVEDTDKELERIAIDIGEAYEAEGFGNQGD